MRTRAAVLWALLLSAGLGGGEQPRSRGAGGGGAGPSAAAPPAPPGLRAGGNLSCYQCFKVSGPARCAPAACHPADRVCVSHAVILRSRRSRARSGRASRQRPALRFPRPGGAHAPVFPSPRGSGASTLLPRGLSAGRGAGAMDRGGRPVAQTADCAELGRAGEGEPGRRCPPPPPSVAPSVAPAAGRLSKPALEETIKWDGNTLPALLKCHRANHQKYSFIKL